MDTVTYEEFLRAKMVAAPERGASIAAADISPVLFPHQAAIARWAIQGGRRAIFAAFGSGKTLMQLEIARRLLQHDGGRFLICAPLGVRQEFRRDAERLGADWTFIRETAGIGGEGLYLTNYESIREGKIDVNKFIGASLDEASILRGFGGTKTFREFMRLFEFNERLKYRFVATATPSPNEYIELLAYAGFLEVMDIGQAKTRFFKRDSTKADKLTLHPHKETEFWNWVSTWAIFLQHPSDLCECPCHRPSFVPWEDCCICARYTLPEVDIRWHEVSPTYADAGHEPGGQGRLMRNAALGLSEAAREKRESRPARIAKLLELRTEDPGEHRIIWHDLESERHAIEAAIPECVSVYGNQKLEDREESIIAFSDGKIAELAGKPSMLGSGCNFQYHCHWAIYLGIGFKFNDFIQAFHRIVRFGQTKRVRIDLIYTEAEREIRQVLLEKWERHKELVAQMTGIIRQYGLASNAISSQLQRAYDVQRIEVTGENYTLVNNDSVEECKTQPPDSVGLILTSIPFSTQYEYSPSYRDFGHSDSNEHFFEQMDFLTPELYRMLKPGRVAAIHVKDRIVPGGLTGLGFQTVYPFHSRTIEHYQKHGFAYLGMKTIVTDVVRENNQTYRLGWSEQCKDGSRMGVGMPEYLLLFRKPPTDRSKGYADEPVIKSKADYSRSRWQVDAHGFARSSGNRLLTTADIQGEPHQRIFRLFRQFSREHVYDFEHHVALSESLETCQDCGHIHLKPTVCGQKLPHLGPLDSGWGPDDYICKCHGAGRLPVTFMLLQPQSWSEEVWSDITRMLSLNSAQAAAGREMHLCPMQFDIADRAIAQFSQPGEIVCDPFVGIGTVVQRALKLKRRGLGIELSKSYFRDAVYYCEAAEKQADVPSLFDLTEPMAETECEPGIVA
jgi:DNA modification methylase